MNTKPSSGASTVRRTVRHFGGTCPGVPVTPSRRISMSPRHAPARWRLAAPWQTRSGSGRTKEQTQAIREWAQANGYEVSDRGPHLAQRHRGIRVRPLNLRPPSTDAPPAPVAGGASVLGRGDRALSGYLISVRRIPEFRTPTEFRSRRCRDDEAHPFAARGPITGLERNLRGPESIHSPAAVMNGQQPRRIYSERWAAARSRRQSHPRDGISAANPNRAADRRSG